MALWNTSKHINDLGEDYAHYRNSETTNDVRR
jgi:hypothetical protein